MSPSTRNNAFGRATAAGPLRPGHQPYARSNWTRQLQPTLLPPDLTEDLRHGFKAAVLESEIEHFFAQVRKCAGLGAQPFIHKCEPSWEVCYLKYDKTLQGYHVGSPSVVTYDCMIPHKEYMWDNIALCLGSALRYRVWDRYTWPQMLRALEFALQSTGDVQDVLLKVQHECHLRSGLNFHIPSELFPLFGNTGTANREAFVRTGFPAKRIPRRVCHYDLNLVDYSKSSHLEGSGRDLTILESYREFVSAETEEVPSSDTETPHEMTMTEWRSGPGRKKSWKSHCKDRISSRIQHWRRQDLNGAKNTEQLANSRERSRQNQRLGRQGKKRNRYVQKFQRGNVKQRMHYLCDDDFEQYETSTQAINEPRISIKVAKAHDAHAGMHSIDQMPTVFRNPGSTFYDYDNIPWVFKRGHREEAIYQHIMADLPPRLLENNTENGTTRVKKHKQRGINKFRIPQFNNLEDLSLCLEGYWVSLLEKSILLRRMVTGQESATIESYRKLYKTVEARRRQLVQLESTYSELNDRYKRICNEVTGMKDEMNKLRNWLASAIDQYQVMKLQSALHKDRFIESLPRPKVKSPPKYPLLHKHGILYKDTASLARLLERSSDDWYIMRTVEGVRIDINTWYARQLSPLRRELQSSLLAQNLAGRR